MTGPAQKQQLQIDIEEKKANRDKKVFIYILVYFYWFLNASTIIKIRNHLASFTSHSTQLSSFGAFSISKTIKGGGGETQ